MGWLFFKRVSLKECIGGDEYYRNTVHRGNPIYQQSTKVTKRTYAYETIEEKR